MLSLNFHQKQKVGLNLFKLEFDENLVLIDGTVIPIHKWLFSLLFSFLKSYYGVNFDRRPINENSIIVKELVDFIYHSKIPTQVDKVVELADRWSAESDLILSLIVISKRYDLLSILVLTPELMNEIAYDYSDMDFIKNFNSYQTLWKNMSDKFSMLERDLDSWEKIELKSNIEITKPIIDGIFSSIAYYMYDLPKESKYRIDNSKDIILTYIFNDTIYIYTYRYKYTHKYAGNSRTMTSEMMIYLKTYTKTGEDFLMKDYGRISPTIPNHENSSPILIDLMQDINSTCNTNSDIQYWKDRILYMKNLDLAEQYAVSFYDDNSITEQEKSESNINSVTIKFHDLTTHDEFIISFNNKFIVWTIHKTHPDSNDVTYIVTLS